MGTNVAMAAQEANFDRPITTQIPENASELRTESLPEPIRIEDCGVHLDAMDLEPDGKHHMSTKSKWQSMMDIRQPAGLTPIKELAKSLNPPYAISEPNKNRPRSQSLTGKRSHWTLLKDLRNVRGRATDESGGLNSGRSRDGGWPSPKTSFADLFRASRSKWKVDTGKGTIMEESDMDEEWLLGGEESLVPVSAIVDALVIQPIISQYR